MKLNLKCLAARVVRRHKVEYQDIITVSLQEFVILRRVKRNSKIYIITLHPAKTPIRLFVNAVLSVSSLGALMLAKDSKFLHTDLKTDQTAQMRWLPESSMGAHVIWKSF